MSENKKLIPKRRFKEFQNTDAWEQRELGEVTIINPQTSLPNVFEYVDLESVVGTEMISHRTEEKSSAPSRAQRLAKQGDIFYQTVRPYQKNNYLFDKLDNNYVFSTGYAQLRPEINSDFLMSYIQDERFVLTVLSNCTGTSYPAISPSSLSKIMLNVPIIGEQEKVGTFFATLDQTLAFQQRKLEKMKSMKSAYLSEMFPAAGERKPKRRFPGFTDDWKQCKLEDMCSLITKQTGFDYSATIKPSLINKKNDSTYSFIQNKDFSGFNINLNTDFYIPVKIAEKFPRILLDQPSLLVTISGKIGNLGLYNDVKKAFIGGAVGICKLNDLKEGEFILYELTSEFGQRQFRKSTKTSSHANITVEMIKDIDIIIPKNHIEHNKISKFFKQLDTTIAFQQQKLEKLQNIKKAYLNEMFI